MSQRVLVQPGTQASCPLHAALRKPPRAPRGYVLHEVLLSRHGDCACVCDNCRHSPRLCLLPQG